MILVLNSHPGDRDLARLQLEVAARLEKRADHLLILACEEGQEEEVGRELGREADRAFKRVKVFTYSPWKGKPEWPGPQNWAWQQVAKLAPLDGPWFWWEPDVTPLREGWADELERRYLQEGKPFMGMAMPISGHMNGVAVYPPQVSKYSRVAIRIASAPFDMVLGQELGKDGWAMTDGLIGFWVKGEGRKGRSFGKDEAKDLVAQGFVVYHGGDDSLPKAMLSRWPGFPKGKRKAVTFRGKGSPKIHLVTCEDSPRSWHETKRMDWARKSWEALGDQGVVVHSMTPPFLRDSRAIRDHRALPFIKDMFNRPLAEARDGDLIAFSNSDTAWSVEAPGILREFLQDRDAAEVRRLEFYEFVDPGQPAKVLAGKGRKDVGRDGFAFRVGWLRGVWGEFPDFLHGEELWDLCMAVLVRWAYGIPTSWESSLKGDARTEPQDGILLHVNHDKDRVWARPAADDLPGKRWNRGLARQFFEARGLEGGPHFRSAPLWMG